MRRHILVISRDEQLGRWFRYMLAGRRTGLPTTVATDLETGLRALRRLRPRVVIFVSDHENPDDELMLLRVLLLIQQRGDQNTLALLYDPQHDRLTMYHNVHLRGVRREDVATTAVDTVSCPLFGYQEETRSDYPKDCHYLPLLIRGAAVAARACGVASSPVAGELPTSGGPAG
jgi:hypothetical protein